LNKQLAVEKQKYEVLQDDVTALKAEIVRRDMLLRDKADEINILRVSIRDLEM
jgi:cell division protein FtsB